MAKRARHVPYEVKSLRTTFPAFALARVPWSQEKLTWFPRDTFSKQDLQEEVAAVHQAEESFDLESPRIVLVWGSTIDEPTVGCRL